MGKRLRPLRSMWQAISSPWLAAILLAGVLLALLLISLFPHLPADPDAHQPWLAAATLRYGRAGELLYKLGLFTPPLAPWFLVLLAALLLNTLACSVQRLSHLWRSWARRPVKGPAPDAKLGQRRLVHTMSLLSHVAVLLLLVAVAVRPALLWQQSGVTLLPGEVYQIDRAHPLTAHQGEPLALQAGVLAVERWPGGQLRDLRVPVVLTMAGRPAVTTTVRMNHPVVCRGLSFHLQGYGPAVRITTVDRDLYLALPGGQAREIELGGTGLTLQLVRQPGPEVPAVPGGDPTAGDLQVTWLVEAHTADGTLLGSSSVADGQQIELAGTPVTFQVSYFTIWQLCRDPTYGLATGATGLFLAATAATLLLRERRRNSRLETYG